VFNSNECHDIGLHGLPSILFLVHGSNIYVGECRD